MIYTYSILFLAGYFIFLDLSQECDVPIEFQLKNETVTLYNPVVFNSLKEYNIVTRTLDGRTDNNYMIFLKNCEGAAIVFKVYSKGSVLSLMSFASSLDLFRDYIHTYYPEHGSVEIGVFKFYQPIPYGTWIEFNEDGSVKKTRFENRTIINIKPEQEPPQFSDEDIREIIGAISSE